MSSEFQTNSDGTFSANRCFSSFYDFLLLNSSTTVQTRNTRIFVIPPQDVNKQFVSREHYRDLSERRYNEPTQGENYNKPQ